MSFVPHLAIVPTLMAQSRMTTGEFPERIGQNTGPNPTASDPT